MVKIVALGGSLRPDSYSFQALQIAADRVRELGAEVEILNLRELNLPFSQQEGNYPDVIRLQNAVKAADGLIIATPEYHGSVSGAVKNALDLLSFEHLAGKVVGLVSVLGGQSNSNALNHLRLIFRWVHAWVIPEQVAIGQAWNAFDEAGNLKDEKLAERFHNFAKSLVEHTKKLQ
jgi:NAD(P)H-dependent FMN reductase